MTPASRTTGAIAALLVFLGIGLFGQMGWLAALVLALIAGGLLALMLGWLNDQGGMAMHGSEWDALSLPAPGPMAVMPGAPSLVIRDGGPDDLRAIKGVGPKVQQALEQAGVTRYAQIAAWDDADVDRIAAGIGRAASRIRNDDWVGQARMLAAGVQGTG